MSKKLSIYAATYGKRLDEVDLSAANIPMTQNKLEISDNDGDDPVSDGFEVADAIDFLGEYFMKEALNSGYDNINDLAIAKYRIDPKHPDPGSKLIEDMIPLYFRGEIR